MVREMPAYKVEPEMPEEEFFGPDQREELRKLRQRQIEGKFAPEDGERLKELTAMETEAKTGHKPLDDREHKRYLELSKMDSYTPEQSAEFAALQERLDKADKV